ncbi:MAG: hypothetical protein HFI31_05395 [Lachnospiraceae bacterium]|nr:hypothetical protein [Lachnospiraceae bacterium]
MEISHRDICLLSAFSDLYYKQLCSGEAGNGEPWEPYTYTVTFYAGNQGSFTGSERISIVNRRGGRTNPQIRMRSDGTAITVTGLEAGDTVTFDDIQGSGLGAPVKLEENSPYYVRGLRKSGYDNDTVFWRNHRRGWRIPWRRQSGSRSSRAGNGCRRNRSCPWKRPGTRDRRGRK